MAVVFDLLQQTQFPEIFHDPLSCLISLHAGILACIFIHNSPVVHDPDLLQIMTQTHFKVIGIVSRCYLDHTCPELLVYIRICNHRDLPVHQGQYDSFPDQITVSLILRIDCNGGISEHRLGSGGGYCHKSATVFYRIPDMPEAAILLFMLHFCVRYGCAAFGTPVDYAVSSVDEAFLIEPDENLQYSL